MTRLEVDEWVGRAMAAGYSRQRAEALGQTVRVLRGRNYAYRTEQTYSDWVRRFLARDPGRAALPVEEDVRDFLEWLAVEGNVAVATQKQALNALASFFPRGDQGGESEFRRVCGSAGAPEAAGGADPPGGGAIAGADEDVRTTEIYTHVLGRPGDALASPLDDGMG